MFLKTRILYAQKHHLGKEAVSHAREIEVGAEIKMGEFLRAMEKNKGGGYTHGEKATPSSVEGVTPATYEEIGITYKEAHNAQALADMPPTHEEISIKKKAEHEAMQQAPEGKKD